MLRDLSSGPSPASWFARASRPCPNISRPSKLNGGSPCSWSLSSRQQGKYRPGSAGRLSLKNSARRPWAGFVGKAEKRPDSDTAGSTPSPRQGPARASTGRAALGAELLRDSARGLAGTCACAGCDCSASTPRRCLRVRRIRPRCERAGAQLCSAWAQAPVGHRATSSGRSSGKCRLVG